MLKQISDQNAAKKNVNIHTFRYKHINLFIQKIMNQAIIKTIDLGDGRTITIETGRLAKQADCAVVVKMGDTMLLATVVAAVDAKEDVDFMPLSVDYREKFAAAWRFPGGFLKR